MRRWDRLLDSYIEEYRARGTFLKFQSALFSIPTAPTIHLSDGWTLNKNTRGKKGQIRSMLQYL
jgi:hypothetical protein